MYRNQFNKVFLEFLRNSGVNYFTQNQPNNFFKTKKVNNLNNLNDINTIDELKAYINISNIYGILDCLLSVLLLYAQITLVFNSFFTYI